MRIDVFTIFAQLVDSFASESVIGRGRREGVLDLRAFGRGVHQSVDDAPFGGGAGMVMAAPPVFAAVEKHEPPRPLLYLSPAGKIFDQRMAEQLAASGGFSLLCGRYEGIDERIREHLVDAEVSVGDVVLAGGEVAALLIVEAVGRLVPGVVGNADSITEESFTDHLLEYPHFTRPAVFRGWQVPRVLLSGDHGQVARWRKAQALRQTLNRRPDLIARRGGLSDQDKNLLAEFGYLDEF
ncbi:MAG: tRNA (guanosine(37)-N1)-methyltransferase TrmD [Acidimicrobiia bacterium]|nr:tRNA (guanosine(37)-N1)-methyltransferase TrmD [Acidimicrobiia bacterium]